MEDTVFTINALPATFGDCLLIEYGIPENLRRILIDGGTGGTAKMIISMLEALPEEKRVVELLVVTHIDQDHIEGILAILKMEKLPFSVKSIWFNGYLHIPDTDAEDFGPEQGELLTEGIQRHKLRWNHEFDGNAVVVPDNGDLPVVILLGGIKLTLLSPTAEKLRQLKPIWEEELKKNNLVPGFGYNAQELEVNIEGSEDFGEGLIDIETLASYPFDEDKREGNGSSIAFIAEYMGKSVLLCADAHPSVILDSLDRLSKGVHEFDLVKVSHHGSHSNTGPDFLKKIITSKFLVSTNGSRYKHPHQGAIAQIILCNSNCKEIYFNYRTRFNDMWDNAIFKSKYHYKTFYPAEGNPLILEI